MNCPYYIYSVFKRPHQLLSFLFPRACKLRPPYFFPPSAHLAVQPLRNHLSVHDRDVHEEKQDYKEIIHESQEAEKRLGEDVERRGQVGESTNEAEENTNPEHPEEAAHGEHLPEGMTEQSGNISQPLHKLRKQRRGNITKTLFEINSPEPQCTS